MNTLATNVRPIVLFDPSNANHRRFFTEFVQTGKWVNCPVRFTVNEDGGDLIGHMYRKLVAWYGEQEQQGNFKTNSKQGDKSLGITTNGVELNLLDNI